MDFVLRQQSGFPAAAEGFVEGDEVRGQRRDEIAGLKNEADALAPVAGFFVLARPARIVAEDNTISLGLIQNAGDDRDERRFAATGWTDVHHQFVRAHFLVNAAQRLDCGCAFAERFPKASAFDGNIVPARVTRDT